MTDFLGQYLKLLTSQYPSVGVLPDLESRFKNLISDIEISLPISVYAEVAKSIQTIYKFAHSAEFTDALISRSSPEEQKLLHAPIKNHSVLMAYDFHYNFETKKLSLIEINTNASAYLIVDLLYKEFGSAERPWGDPLKSLKKSFLNELALGDFTGSPRTAIIDDKIESQKMYPEFLMYKYLFESWGWPCSLQEQVTLEPEKFDLIYNRSTDFIFADPHLIPLKNAFCANQTIFSPNPREYLLLAAKDRLIDFTINKLFEVVPISFDLKNHNDIEQVWADRKKLFFKPKRSYGSKGVYRGSSISRKMFESLLNQDVLVQEYCPPGEFNGWKFDLRFYAYQDEIQLGTARLYQGQVTNFSTEGGGLSRLTFV